MKTVTEQRIIQLATQAHDEWRAPRLLPEGTYEPRLKQVKDQEWITLHNGQTTCDIANTPYRELPLEWQAENHAGAQVAIDLVEARLGTAGTFDRAFIEEASAIIHSEWIKRNPWADDTLKVPYSQLPESEKEKDRLFVRAALMICLQNEE